MNELLNRFKQESTWRGLIAILTSFGITVSPELANGIIATGVAVIGLINILKKD